MSKKQNTLSYEKGNITINNSNIFARDSEPRSRLCVKYGKLVYVSLSLHVTTDITFSDWTTVFTLPFNIVDAPYFLTLDNTDSNTIGGKHPTLLVYSDKTLKTLNIPKGFWCCDFCYFTE